jgi:50S ribosomal protein L16 3-hydroxylase
MKIHNFNVTHFREHVWQQTPLVIRKGFDSVDWLEPDDLAGLACEEGVEARIIYQHDKVWHVEHGPFPEARFSSLPERDWTLLVQAVDHWVPEVSELLSAFDFLPSWRLDDIMVSYAPVGGTVSQHFDYYDVFLIQGEGSRRWQIGQFCDADSRLIPNSPVKILQEFEVSMDVTLMPGDILYIPARFAHYGVSVEDSLTYSVGFRAPGLRDMIDGISTLVLEKLSDELRYRDTPESLQAAKGEIPDAAVEQVRGLLLAAVNDKVLIRDWLGGFVTERKYPDLEKLSIGMEECLSRLDAGEQLIRAPGSRFAYAKTEVGGQALLFVDGERYDCRLGFAKYLTESPELNGHDLLGFLYDAEQHSIMEMLLVSGALMFEGDLE